MTHRTTPFARRLALAPSIALALACATAGAQQTLEYRIQPGDTLEALAREHLGAAQHWPALAKRNGITNPRRLVPGSLLQIPADLLPNAHAQVVFVHGPVQADSGTPLQAGQQLAEGERLAVPAGAFVTVRLADGTLVRVQADSRLALRQLRRRAGNAQSVLELERGAVESSVAPQPNAARHFEIRTLQASASVRGTQFGVTLTADGRTLTSVSEGTVAVHTPEAPEHAPSARVAAGQGVVAGAALGPVQALLPAPDLSALPERFEDATWLALQLPPLVHAGAYRVEIARDAQFAEVVASGASSAPALRLATPEDGRYLLGVRTLAADGLPGARAVRTITIKARPVAPLYQSAPGATLDRASGQLACTQVAGAAHYRIQVATDAGFAQPRLDHQGPACAAPLADLPPGRYHWRAASIRTLADGSADQGPFAQPQTVVVADAPTALAASALQPRSAGGVQELHWPAEPGQRFRLQLSDHADFAAPLLEQWLDAPRWTVPALAPGAYFVRLQTQDPSGLQSAFSAPRRFEAHAPAAVLSGTGLPVTAGDGQPLAR